MVDRARLYTVRLQRAHRVRADRALTNRLRHRDVRLAVLVKVTGHVELKWSAEELSEEWGLLSAEGRREHPLNNGERLLFLIEHLSLLLEGAKTKPTREALEGLLCVSEVTMVLEVHALRLLSR